MRLFGAEMSTDSVQQEYQTVAASASFPAPSLTAIAYLWPAISSQPRTRCQAAEQDGRRA